MRNAEIATALDELAYLYELDGAVIYRVVAYRQAARAVRDSPRSVAELAAERRATELPHIVKALDAQGEPERGGRLLLSAVLGIGDQIVEALRDHSAADRVEIAGSARRMTDTCKDLDIIATAHDAAALTERFVALDLVGEVKGSGEAGARIVTH